MKYRLLGLATLLLSTYAFADNYRIVQSPTQKLDVWIDDVKDNQLASWCKSRVDLRIVSTGEKNAAVLDDFLPRVAGLMASQCKPLQQLHWQLTDADGSEIATGSAVKAQQWQTVVTLPSPSVEPPPAAVAEPAVPVLNSPQADTTPWLQFSLPDGCHFRTWWQHPAQANALFVPSKQGLICGQDGWLSGYSSLTLIGNGTAKTVDVTFLKGFPITGLNSKSQTGELNITTVNRERMVLSNHKSPDSWLVLPFNNQFNGWQAPNQVVVQMPARDAENESVLQARLREVSIVWAPWLSGNAPIGVQLVEQLHPELQDPAVAVYRTIN
ncbi:conserved hypothetical protein [Pectobacterium parmentieri WPP163]|uniref:hypothetical protein n=1 Tax=Pectobacterium parmentieri TaxID=1905730 RepID=UPI0001B107D1|nr:hypothetical protein [Pectobacterium parmentieri]ACX88215.1 conserved hypothetical protein [Pectobacterium parmentieri WPP163]QQA77989.1 hypothetical protein JBL47_10685 [Pectobacterium parmentieri]